MNRNILMSIFYPIVFMSFGLGLSMGQRIGDKLIDGYWFMGIGFLFFILLRYFVNEEEKENKK